MKADLPENIVEDIAMAVVLMGETPEVKSWTVYLVNLKNEPITNVLISSKGYGEKDGKQVKTSVLRHFVGDMEAHSFAGVEAIDPEVFGLTNEYWLSYYMGNTIYDKKFIFLPESIIDSNLIKIPLVNRPGVMIK
ncbi:hypothetical protein H9N25_07170 [Pedobacter riviphilus]|uniref:Uncharacterized protein n=1 Tax=Pedobacter riviphilus TaxID=2766984 RepID=A0ABX6TLX0_9SPHI|nr:MULTISPECIES: hypothetical protein [Pedobacter]NII82415.1 hypothetical protein [Pedobacter sp. SG908]NMN36441.1 hypothetical protein [Pedobacter sp. SG918]QNR86181.1 hypothetical protein H9N25_07170 [Pedobacter riviphilus]